MGAVGSKSGKVVCKERIELLKLALQCRDQLEEAQNKYHNLHNKLADTITEFVLTYSSHYKNSEMKVEAQFQKAYKSGNNVSKLLKTEDVRGQSTAERKKFKLCRSLTMSCSCMVPSSACDDEDEDEEKPRKHTSTLKKLYDWETQLYHEVKKLENDGGGKVAKKCVVSTIKQVQKLRDEELQQQIVELINAIMRDWKLMSGCHRILKDIMSKAEKPSYSPPPYGLMVSDASHLKKTSELKQHISNWRTGFASYISSQKAYVKALDDWISHSFPSFCEDDNDNHNDRPSLLAKWSDGLEELPEKEVTHVMRSFQKKVGTLELLLKKEKEQKRRLRNLRAGLRGRLRTLRRRTERSWRD